MNLWLRKLTNSSRNGLLYIFFAPPHNGNKSSKIPGAKANALDLEDLEAGAIRHLA